ncbi:hypothetical protein D9M72_489740 [compost metagenome]
MPDIFGERRQYHRSVHAERAEEPGQQHYQQEGRPAADVAEPREDLPAAPERRRAGVKPGRPDRRDQANHRQAYDGVRGEGGGGTRLGDQQAAQGGSSHRAELADRVVQPDRGTQRGVAHHLVHEHLAGRTVDRGRDAQGHATGVHGPDGDAAAGVQDREGQGQQRGDGLADQQYAALRKQVHQDAAERAHHQHGQELERHGHAHGSGAARQLQDQPVLGKALHPDPGAARELNGNEEPVVALRQGVVPAKRPF